jgi:hypothetical protein
MFSGWVVATRRVNVFRMGSTRRDILGMRICHFPGRDGSEGEELLEALSFVYLENCDSFYAIHIQGVKMEIREEKQKPVCIVSIFVL